MNENNLKVHYNERENKVTKSVTWRPLPESVTLRRNRRWGGKGRGFGGGRGAGEGLEKGRQMDNGQKVRDEGRSGQVE